MAFFRRCYHIQNYSVLNHYCKNCLFVTLSWFIICDKALATKGNVMLLWGSAHDTNAYECLVLFVCLFFYLVIPPSPSLSLPRLFWLDLRAAVTVPLCNCLDTQLAAAEKLCCCKGRRKKGFFCGVCFCGYFLFVCFLQPQNTELGRAWSCPVECPKPHLASFRKHEIKSAPEKWNQTYMKMLNYWTKIISFFLAILS